MARGWIRHMLTSYEEKEERKSQRSEEIGGFADIFSLPENEFLQNYKISKDMIHYLCQELAEDLTPRTSRGYPVHVKVLTALRILLDGHYQRGNGNDDNVSVGQTTVSKYLHQFVTAVNARLKPRWISFPGTETTRQAVSSGYENKCGLPNILGAIDCTYVKILATPGFNDVQYLNRNGDMSINVQLIADVDCRILNVNANFPGRVHDQYIFNNSVVKEELKRLYKNRIGQYYLLGDSDYVLEPWLMTPIRGAAAGSPENLYTNWHCETRNVIERTTDYLKGTFRSLGMDRNLHYSPTKASQMIYACCTIYNIMKHFRVPLSTSQNHLQPAQEEEVAAEDGEPQYNAPLLQLARQNRENIVNRYFA